MHAYYSDRFVLPLPEGHRFPMAKYRMLRERIAAELPQVDLREPQAASDGVLALAHSPQYVQQVATNTLAPLVQRAIGFPWSEQMVERSRRSVGATIDAARAAFADGLACNLAGGTHHAFAEKGGGFCVFNDAAVAARLMQAEAHRSGRRHLQVAIIDLDVHQGDGTASILAGDASIFTLSLHGEKNYPAHKQLSDLDVPLPDGTDDAAYLHALDAALAELDARCQPGFAIYLAGADPHQGDRLGRLKLTVDGLAARDERVFRWLHERRIPAAVAMAGGYNQHIETTVQIHFNTVAAAAAWSTRWRARAAA
ncbi:MAG TPA: histone deacetylase [Burkholderiaceae bacterium]|nr:histone deacetylase [Burkholderiaceae bacterium]